MRRMPVASAGAARRAARAHGAAACWVMCGIGDRAAGLARCARRAHPMGRDCGGCAGPSEADQGVRGGKDNPESPAAAPSACMSAAARPPLRSSRPSPSLPGLARAFTPLPAPWLSGLALAFAASTLVSDPRACAALRARAVRSRRDVCHSPPQHRLTPPHPTPRPGGALVALSCRPSCVEVAARTRPVAGAGAGAGDRRPL